MSVCVVQRSFEGYEVLYQKIKTVQPITFTTDSINGIIIVAIRWIGIENLGQERNRY